MPLVALPDLLQRAREGRYAVGYFEAWDLYSLEAVVAAAERERSPVIIGIGALTSDHAWLQERGIAIYGGVVNFLASRASVPVAAMFNEARDVGEAEVAVAAGYNAVMMHTSGWSAQRALADTTRLVAAGRLLGVAVEGEVGELPSVKNGQVDETEARMAGVDQAVDFVRQTDVDCLAVAVGSVHFATDDHASTVDIELIRKLAAAVGVPLVLHGGSGVSSDQLRAAVGAGIAKVNVGTRLKVAYARALRDAVSEADPDPNLSYGSRYPRDVFLQAAAPMSREVALLMRVFGSSGRCE